MKKLRSSVLIASRGRPDKLNICLRSLAAQITPASEVIVVWQGDDTATRDAAESVRHLMPDQFIVMRSADIGIVAAENVALAAAIGDIVLLIDDDAVAPMDWVQRHLCYYSIPGIGAVGGPFYNFDSHGAPFPERASEPIAKLTWYGKPFGNSYDLAPALRSCAPREVDHLAGGNMSVRRCAFDRFEVRLKPYWQMFETDVCLQVKARGYKVIFDFANRIDHYPTNTIFTHGRGGDLALKIFNPAYNHAFVLSKHSRGRALRMSRLAYLLAMGSISVPGVLAVPSGIRRFGDPARELRVLAGAWRAHLAGWIAGTGSGRTSARS